MSYHKPNTIIKLKNGRIGTTCYNGLDGVGIKYGEHHFNINKDFPEPDLIIKEPEKNIIKIIRHGSWK